MRQSVEPFKGVQQKECDRQRSTAAASAGRRNMNIAAVALANKNARIAWALLAHQRDFAPDYVSSAPSR
jgi:hypothetical protein